MIRARDLGFRAEGAVLVEGVGLSVEAHDRLAIIGPNGAGKTTLLRMLAGVLRPGMGVVTLDGRDLARIPAVERARSIAVVGQSDQPDPRLSVLEYVALGRVPHAGRRGDDRRIALAALERSGLLPMAGRSMGSLSGGERQRAQIARAIAQQPRILFLDEPTNHLDPRARGEVLELVAGLGIAVVAVLHDLSLVAPFASRVAVLDRGRLVACDTPDRALSLALVRRVFGVDVLRLPHPTDARELTVFDIPIRLSTP
ncbi:ABC transporter ATP-binding protein [Paenirhodobacter sp.]|uniref:ABC transporter ATP-binding protein n=1 Tax=Paenirhodobacter sp. TaxID=1965326 RepID=UPI003B3E0CC7